MGSSIKSRFQMQRKKDPRLHVKLLNLFENILVNLYTSSSTAKYKATKLFSGTSLLMLV